jgi:hypothetical protein
MSYSNACVGVCVWVLIPKREISLYSNTKHEIKTS